MSKKIVLLIVEGITEDIALRGVLSEIFNDNRIEFCLVRTDITTREDIRPNNIKKELGNIVKNFLGKTFRETDLQEVIHLVDTDGVYIPEANIEEDVTLNSFVYSTDKIKAKDINKVVERNEIKKANLEVLISTNEVLRRIPYKVYYLSQNLEHFFHDKLNCSREEKNGLAQLLEDRYIEDLTSFLTFVRDSKLKSPDDYSDYWNYIKKSTNSLSRCSNIHIFLKGK